MAKKVYVGIDGKARQVKKIYIGIGGLARKVKKAYVGVGGIARIFWSGGELAYYGTADPLSSARFSMGAATVGGHLLFAGGGIENNVTYNTVDAYDSSLTQSALTPLTMDRAAPAAAVVGDYALFAGGSSHDYGIQLIVDAYDSSLTKTQAPDITNVGGKGASAGVYAVFPVATGTDVYDASLTRTAAEKLKVSGEYGAASIGEYAVFGGGGNLSYVQTFNGSLTLQELAPLQQGRSCEAVSGGGHVIFGGGTWDDDGFCYGTVTDAYDSTLTKVTQSVDCGQNYQYGVAAVGEYALFAGGYLYSDTVTALDAALTRTDVQRLSRGRSNTTGGTIGSYALFAGGQTGANAQRTDVVDVYTA